jgi:hypothetical protein
MKKTKLDPVSDDVFTALMTYYVVRGEGGDPGLNHVEISYRMTVLMSLEAALDHAAPADSVYRQEAESFRETSTVEERIPRLVGILTALIPSLPSGKRHGLPDDVPRLYQRLKLLCPPAYAVLQSVRKRGRPKDGLAAQADIAACRNGMENFFKTLGGRPKWAEGLEAMVKDEELKAVAQGVYRFLSKGGTHSERPEEQNPADSILALRLTEGLLVRVLVEIGKW